MPRLVNPSQPEMVVAPEQSPVTPEQVNRVMGPVSEVVDHPLPEHLKRRYEEESRNGQESPTSESWRPDPRVTQMLDLHGETAQEIAAELDRPGLSPVEIDAHRTDEIHGADVYGEVIVPDLNQQIAEFLQGEEVETALKRAQQIVEVRDSHIVPLEDQLTEEEEEDQREGPQSLLQQVTPETSPADPLHDLSLSAKRPWSSWPKPSSYTALLHEYNLAKSGVQLVLMHGDRPLCAVTGEALTGLGRRCAFPPEFVAKLSSRVAMEVVNERIQQAQNQEMTVLIQNEKWLGTVPAHRGVVSFRHACDVTYEVLRRYYTDLKFEQVEANGGLSLRLLTPVVYPVTDAEGDALIMGIDVQHSYDKTLEVSLLVKRVKCGSQIVANTRAFSWKQRSEDGCSVERQVEWLENSILHCIGSFTHFVTCAKELSEETFKSDYTQSLRFIGQSLGIRKIEVGDLVATYELEPNPNDWGAVCAAARLATYGNIENKLELQKEIGDWIING